MSKEILEAVRELEAQKSIDAEVLLVALEEALGAAYRKTPESQGKHARVEIDRDTGDFRVMQIDADDEQLEALGLLEYPLPPEMSEIPVAEPERPRRERPAFYIRADRDPDPIDNEPDAIIEWDQLAQHGIIAYDATPMNFGRIAAQTATQVILPDGSPLTGASSVTVGFHACAVLADTTVRCWGYNAFGGLGDGATTVRTRAAAVVMAGGAALAGISGNPCAVE